MLLLKVLHNSERHSQVQLLYIQQTKSPNHVSSGHLQEVIKMESYKSPSPKNAHGGLWEVLILQEVLTVGLQLGKYFSVLDGWCQAYKRSGHT